MHANQIGRRRVVGTDGWIDSRNGENVSLMKKKSTLGVAVERHDTQRKSLSFKFILSLVKEHTERAARTPSEMIIIIITWS